MHVIILSQIDCYETSSYVHSGNLCMWGTAALFLDMGGCYCRLYVKMKRRFYAVAHSYFYQMYGYLVTSVYLRF
jgi:hypothetical protein